MEIARGQSTTEVIRAVISHHPNIEFVHVTAFEGSSDCYEEEVAEPRRIARTEVLYGDWQATSRKMFDRTYLGISSLVTTDNGPAHIPMLDYDRGNGDNSMRRLRRIVNKFTLPDGFILRSGRGLHYLGVELLDNNRFMRVLGDLWSTQGPQGLCPRWGIASAEREFGVLRICAGPTKPVVPYLVGFCGGRLTKTGLLLGRQEYRQYYLFT